MTRRTVTTVREYDAEGRLVKETVTETADDNWPQNWPQLNPFEWTYPATLTHSAAYLAESAQ